MSDHCRHTRRASYEPEFSVSDESDYQSRCLDCGMVLRDPPTPKVEAQAPGGVQPQIGTCSFCDSTEGPWVCNDRQTVTICVACLKKYHAFMNQAGAPATQAPQLPEPIWDGGLNQREHAIKLAHEWQERYISEHPGEIAPSEVYSIIVDLLCALNVTNADIRKVTGQ